MPTTSIVWFRRDLRLSDNPMLSAAVEYANILVPTYVIDDAEDPDAVPARRLTAGTGSGSRAWLADSLRALDASLRERGSGLVIRRGDPATELATLCVDTGARHVFCTSEYEPGARKVEAAVRDHLESLGITLTAVSSVACALPCGSVHNSQGDLYRVFTPYHRAWRTMLGYAHPALAPASLPPLPKLPAPPMRIASAALPEPPAGAPDVRMHGEPGEAGAHRQLERFVQHADRYADEHDLMALDGTSRLSAHLAFGEITPRQIMYAVGADHETFVRQLAWREFAYTTLAGFPAMAERPLRPEFESMPWEDDPAALEAWKAGMTGYPIVDAGMRQLAATGWMHNRVRMITASWLTKDALIDWREGEAHFNELLVDADPALNSFNWQWVAGSGADAAPYFRIMNPTVQATRFDVDGTYVKRWVPELAGLDATWVHRPWEAPAQALAAAGITMGETYPAPCIDHANARRRALDAYASIKRR